MSAQRLLNQTFNDCLKKLRRSSNNDTSEALKLVKALKSDHVYFDYEPFFPTHDRMLGIATTSEMLLRTNTPDIDKQIAFQQIRDAGVSPEFDTIVFAHAIKQSLQDQAGCVSINADLKSMASLQFFAGLIELRKDKDFAIPLQHLTIEAFEGDLSNQDTLDHFKQNIYLSRLQIALDDIDPINHLERDSKRMKAFREAGANVTIIKLDGAIRQAGTDVIHNLEQAIKIVDQYFPDTPILLEQVQTPSEAALLSQQSVSYVQGYKLPQDTAAQIKACQYSKPSVV